MSARTLQLGAAACAAALLAGCAASSAPEAAWEAKLQPLNATVIDSQTTGQARFVQRGNTLDIDIQVDGAPASITHWQHFHGLADGGAATCPDLSADRNGDGIVDLLETEPMAGTTMVPFIRKPQSMDIPHGSYPTADADGHYHYQVSVPLDQLEAAFADAFPGQQLDLDKRVVFIHGVPDSIALPSSVQSLGPIPAQTTLPIACGVIEKAALR